MYCTNGVEELVGVDLAEVLLGDEQVGQVGKHEAEDPRRDVG